MKKEFPQATSVADFCARYQMAVSTYCRRVPLGLAPQFRKIGRRSVILLADENAWLAKLVAGQLGESVDVGSHYQYRIRNY
jgi:hypothetical protein